MRDSMPPRTALIVDDDPPTYDAVRELLPWQQVKVETTADIDEAIECLEKHRYCGLLLNLELSDGRSRGILRHVADRSIDLPIVVITPKFPDVLREAPNADAIKLVLARPLDPSIV